MRHFIFFVLVFCSCRLFSQANLVYGPYLQQGGPSSILVSWRTNVACDSKVSWGTSSVSLNNMIAQSATVTTHTLVIAGLTPNTKYFYTIGNAANTFTCDTFFFYTAPIPNSNGKLSFIASGDCGTAQVEQTNMKKALMYYLNGKYVNGWLLLGDNAYETGTDAEYTSNFFNPYQTGFLMHHTSLFPCPGNHDYANDLNLAANKLIPYYDIFNSPTAGQLGGVASNTEAYYSYNYGNVHFISLDSYGLESSFLLSDTSGSPQYQWLKQDLNANTSTWTIVYFHHPPYTMGSHNSDAELDLVAIRQKITPLLEAKGVDVVLNGHSHNLERSWFIKGHTGMEATFSKTIHAVDTSSAHYDGTPNSCPYLKDSLTKKGTVYVVCGTSGGRVTTTQATYPHDCMYYSNNTISTTIYFEVDSNRLDVRFIGADSLVKDKFTIFKNVKKSKVLNVATNATVTLKASWNGNYSWSNNGATTKFNLFSGSTNTIVIVKDSLNCIADTFKITVVPVGIKEHEKTWAKLYPDPVTGNVVNVQLENATKVKAVSLVDINGRSLPINYIQKQDSVIQLKIPTVEPGIYILNVDTRDSSLKQKLILDQK